jgi:hypothetical protein
MGVILVQEAVRHAHTAFAEAKVPDHVKQLMDDKKCTSLTASSSDFWIALAALKQFVVRSIRGYKRNPCSRHACCSILSLSI